MKNRGFVSRKIGNKIVTAIVTCSAAVALVIGCITIISSSRIIKQDAKTNLSLIAQNKANEFNVTIFNVESSMHSLSTTINSTVQIEKLEHDTNYIKDYQAEIEEIVKGFGENTEGAMGVYFYFNPDVTKGVYGAWLSNEKNNGTFVEQALGTMDEFSPDNEEMEWYYKPANAKKPVWLEPYVDPELNIPMISYVMPVYKDNILIGVAGMDINFEYFQKAVKSTKIYDNGNVALVNQNYDFLVYPENSQKSSNFFTKVKSKLLSLYRKKPDAVTQASEQADDTNFSKMKKWKYGTSGRGNEQKSVWNY
jgi:methyl-accepting chemotaxis protein